MYSALACKYIPSPFYGSREGYKIDTITIHHMAGNFTIETCGNIFQRKGKNASSNYGIGTDGRIACYVDEENRAKTSSNWKNDARAITIEVADDNVETWHVSDVALLSLINLLVDVCKRNGIKQLKWSQSRIDRVNHLDGCNMTVHRDFARTLCPAEYLMSKMPYIAEQVNARMVVTDEVKPVIYEAPFLVRVTAKVLNIRKKAGTHNPIVGEIRNGEVYTIVATERVNSILWGKLKSGAGWICLTYTVPVNIK